MGVQRGNPVSVEDGQIDLLLRHGHVITMDASRQILLDGTIAIQNGRIVMVGDDSEVTPRCKPAQTRDLRGALVQPGFVDAHVHTSFDLIRGLTPDHTRDWTDIHNAYIGALTPEQERLSTLLACMEMVANGVTAFADTGGSLYLKETVDAIERVGLRGIPGAYVADLPTDVEGLHTPIDECLRRLTTQIERYPKSGEARVHCAVTLTGIGTASDDLLVAAKTIADRTGLPLIMHQSWVEEEVTASRKRYGKRPVEHLADLGLLDRNVTLVHMIRVDPREIALVAAAEACVIHCPGASIRRGLGAVRDGKFPEMLAAGITVALGSDGHSGKHDVARQAFLAATLFREFRGEMPTISAQTAFEMATVNGARAIGMEAEVGSIEVGKQADLVIHRSDRPESRPRFRNPISNLVYHTLAQTVDTVLVGGEVILEGGRFTRFDQDAVYDRLDATARDLEEQLAPSWRQSV